jgi:hypothetical protein
MTHRENNGGTGREWNRPISGRTTERWDESKGLNRQNGRVFGPNLPCPDYDPLAGFCEHDIDYRFQ